MNILPTTDADETNPYRWPAAPAGKGEVAATDSPAPRRCFRWRVIPTALLYLYGFGLVLNGLIGLGTILWSTILRTGGLRLGEDGRPTTIDLVVLCPGMVAIGGLLLFAGRNIWLGRWRNGIVASIFVFATVCGVAFLAGFLGLN